MKYGNNLVIDKRGVRRRLNSRKIDGGIYILVKDDEKSVRENIIGVKTATLVNIPFKVVAQKKEDAETSEEASETEDDEEEVMVV